MVTPRFIRYADVVETVRISSVALAAIRAHAAAEPGREACGLLFGKLNHVTAVRPVANVAPDPVRQFEIDPAELFAAIRAERAGGPRWVGCYHSHPNGRAEPSETDRASAADDGKLWLIVAGEEVTAWRATEAGLDLAELEKSHSEPAWLSLSKPSLSSSTQQREGRPSTSSGKPVEGVAP
jgi:desampylase